MNLFVQSVWNWTCLHVHRPRHTADDLIAVNNPEPISFKRIRNESKLVLGRIIQLAVVRSGLGGHRPSLIYYKLAYSYVSRYSNLLNKMALDAYSSILSY